MVILIVTNKQAFLSYVIKLIIYLDGFVCFFSDQFQILHYF